jgi:hypothetical protein
MSDIVRYYESEKNPDRATFPFQPLSDITEAQWNDLSKGQRESVDASGFWRKTKPRPAAKSTKDDQTFTAAEPAIRPIDKKSPAVVPESKAVNDAG